MINDRVSPTDHLLIMRVEARLSVLQTAIGAMQAEMAWLQETISAHAQAAFGLGMGDQVSGDGLIVRAAPVEQAEPA